MAQITGAAARSIATVELSANGSSWTDFSGAITTLTPSGGNKMRSDGTYTLDGDNPLVILGKNELFELTAEAVYTEGASDLFEFLRPLFEAGSDVYIRYAPRGGQTGEFMFTSAAGKVQDLVYPAIDAGSADPLVTGFTWIGPRLTKSVVA